MNKKENLNYLKRSPLPFQGQKRMFVNQFVNFLDGVKYQGEITTIVDLFGGSGLLSHISKRILPNCHVVYNDYDHFSERLNNIPKTNEILEQLRGVIPSDIEYKGRLDPETKNKILEIVKQADEVGFVDFITLSSFMLFSGHYVSSYKDLEKEIMFNFIRKTNVDETSNYLEGLEVTHCDYMELFEKYKDRDDVLFLVDPPYLFTDTKSYSSDKSWTLTNYLDVLLTLDGSNYVFFTSNKTQLIELCQWFDRVKCRFNNPFSQENTLSRISGINLSSKYTDIMLWNLKQNKTT